MAEHSTAKRHGMDTTARSAASQFVALTPLADHLCSCSGFLSGGALDPDLAYCLPDYPCRNAGRCARDLNRAQGNRCRCPSTSSHSCGAEAGLRGWWASPIEGLLARLRLLQCPSPKRCVFSSSVLLSFGNRRTLRRCLAFGDEFLLLVEFFRDFCVDGGFTSVITASCT